MPPKKQQNNPGLGIEYEVLVPAYFALLLNTNPKIEDFKLQSNVEEFGNFDDIVIDIKRKNGENLYFAFQLKHKKNCKKKLSPVSFEEEDGFNLGFNLETYCKAFKKIKKIKRKKYHFILYTNKKCDSSLTNKVKKFDMKQDGCCPGSDLFKTSDDENNLYRFEVKKTYLPDNNVSKKDYSEFFLQFNLYTGQADIEDLEKSILKILKDEKRSAIYINFIRRWHRDDFTNKDLDKKTLNVHLVDIFLSSAAINYYLSDGQDGNSIFFEEMVKEFDITIIDASKKDFVKQLEKKVQKYPKKFNQQEEMIRLAKDSKLINRFSKELTPETKLKLLHYFFQKPLILNFRTNSKDQIYEASKLCRLGETEIKLVIVGKDLGKDIVSKFSHLKTFTNLTKIVGENREEIKRCNLSLQGRNISFGEIFQDDDKIYKFVTPSEIFQMLKGNFSIGEDKENLPECYILRTVSTTVFDIESIIKYSSRSTAIIFYYEDKFEELKILIQNIVRREDYFYEDFLDGIILRKKESPKKQLNQSESRDSQESESEIPAIILRREKCSRKQFDKIYEKLRKEHSERKILQKKSGRETPSNDKLEEIEVHSFKVIDETRCLLLMSTKNIFYNENYKCTKMSVEDKNIHVSFDNSINILCAQPGMGKSTLMKYLKNECDSNFWTVMVDLKAHPQVLKGSQKIKDVLNCFLELKDCEDLFLSNIKKVFLEKKKIVFFLDGLDEVENECVDSVLNITRQLSEMGFRIWLSSRQNLQQKIEDYFNIFAIEINEISKKQQKKFIGDRLKSPLYDENEIKKIVDFIFSNTDLASNRRILEIPLQLHIIAQNFLDNKSYYYKLSKNNFTLTKMLEIFFDGRYEHYLDKVKAKNRHLLEGLKEMLFKNYEIVALHSVLDDEHYEKLQIGKPSYIKILEFLRIIIGKNSENKAVFEHMTYAEYFASKFLVENIHKARILKKEILTENKYQNLFFFFNITLAENSPLHLAIIYKDVSRIEEMRQPSLVDKGGRNFLQVAACVATRHPPLESEPFCSGHLVKDSSVEHFKGEDMKVKEIVKSVLSSDPFKNDKIFEWNSLDYALATGALYIVEAILEKPVKPPNLHEMLEKYYSYEVVAYYSIRFGYHHLLSEILAKTSCDVTSIHSDYLWPRRLLYRNNSILNFLFITSDCTNRYTFIELLSRDDIDKTVYDADGYTFLHFAVLHEDIEFVKFLLEKKANLNVKDKNGRSPLFLAIARNNLEISKLLIENGADVNIEDKNGTSALYWAAERNNLEISKLLIEKGAVNNIKDKYCRSSLNQAAEQEKNNYEISKLQVVKAETGEFPKRSASFKTESMVVDKPNTESKSVTHRTRSIGVDKPNAESKDEVFRFQSKSEASPLHWAAKQNNLEVSKLLVESGADVNIKDKDGWSPLYWAVIQNNFDISKLLIEKGADVNNKDKDCRSPLHWAATRNNYGISKLLIEKGADVNIKNKHGRSSLFVAVEQNNLEITELLVEKGADVNIQTEEGWSPLFLSVKQNNLEITKLLVDKGADVNKKDKDCRSPLHWVANRNNDEILKILIEKGADINREF